MHDAPLQGRRWALAVLLVIAIAGGQFAALATAPAGYSPTGKSLGSAGFSYLASFRIFAAATLWNRIDPLFHTYYGGIPLDRQKFMLPTMRMVTWLDPQFVPAYYVASWVVYRSEGPSQGLAIARDGLANNPRSGVMLSNLAQLLFIEGFQKNRPELLALSKRVIASDTVWATEEDRFEGVAVVRDIFKRAGDTTLSAQLSAELDRMRARGIGTGNHDHNGDGKQDH